MATIGLLTIAKDGFGSGRLRTLLISFDLLCEPNPDKPKPGAKQPSHLLYAKDRDGRGIPVGAMFEAQSERGETYYYGTIDDPSLMAALKIRVFRDQNHTGQPGEPVPHSIVWTRD